MKSTVRILFMFVLQCHVCIAARADRRHEGVEILRAWGVFKPANKIKGRVDPHVEWATEEAMEAFGGVGGGNTLGG
jgi:hypothetical protein